MKQRPDKSSLQTIRKLAVLASGHGTNLQAIIDAVEDGRLGQTKLEIVISDKKEAYALKRAEAAKITALWLDPKQHENRNAYDRILIAALKKRSIDLVVLAGFMRILSAEFVDQFTNRIINIHPALLPSFPGKSAIEQALQYGAKVTGVTIHLVDAKVDHGPILLQQALPISANDTLPTLEEKIHAIEHCLIIQAINLMVSDRVRVHGRLVTIL